MIYRQFSITLAAAMLLSLFVAMIITPAMCAVLLKKQHKNQNGDKCLSFLLKKSDQLLVFIGSFNPI